MLQHASHRRPVGHPAGVGLGNDSPGKGVFRIPQREAGRVHLQPRFDVSLIKFQCRVTVPGYINHRQIPALRNPQHGRIAGLALPFQVHFDRRRTGDDMVVGHSDSGRVNNHTCPPPGCIVHSPHLRVHKAAGGLDLHRGAADFIQYFLGIRLYRGSGCRRRGSRRCRGFIGWYYRRSGSLRFCYGSLNIGIGGTLLSSPAAGGENELIK